MTSLPLVERKTEKAAKDITQKQSQIFQCTSCSYSSNRISNLKRHEHRMHRNLDKKLECCDILFATKCEKRKHVKTNHQNGYECKYDRCNGTFNKKAMLDRHYKCHSSNKDFLCSNCCYGSRFKSNMMQHCRNSGHICPQLDGQKQILRKCKRVTSSETSSQHNDVSNSESTSKDALTYESLTESSVDSPMKNLKRFWRQKYLEEVVHSQKKEILQTGDEEKLQTKKEGTSPIPILTRFPNFLNCDPNCLFISKWSLLPSTHELNFTTVPVNNDSDSPLDLSIRRNNQKTVVASSTSQMKISRRICLKV